MYGDETRLVMWLTIYSYLSIRLNIYLGFFTLIFSLWFLLFLGLNFNILIIHDCLKLFILLNVQMLFDKAINQSLQNFNFMFHGHQPTKIVHVVPNS